MTTIAYDVTHEDMHVFANHYLKTSPAIRDGQRRKAALLAMGFLVIYIWPREEYSAPIYMVMAFLIGVITCTFVARYTPKMSMKQIKALYPPEENKSVIGPHKLELGTEELIETSDGGEQKTAYRSLVKVERTATHTFIYLTSSSAHVIRHTAVRDGDLDTLLSDLKVRVDNAHTPS